MVYTADHGKKVGKPAKVNQHQLTFVSRGNMRKTWPGAMQVSIKKTKKQKTNNNKATEMKELY